MSVVSVLVYPSTKNREHLTGRREGGARGTLRGRPRPGEDSSGRASVEVCTTVLASYPRSTVQPVVLKRIGRAAHLSETPRARMESAPVVFASPLSPRDRLALHMSPMIQAGRLSFPDVARRAHTSSPSAAPDMAQDRLGARRSRIVNKVRLVNSIAIRV